MARIPENEPARPEEVLGALERMAELYRRLWRLSQRQRRLIETGETAGLIQVLEAREKTLERLREIQPGVERAVAAWRERAQDMPETMRSRVRALLSEIDDVLKQVMEADEEDSRRLKVQRDVVAARMGENQRAAQASAAYRSGGPTHAPGGRLDLKDDQR